MLINDFLNMLDPRGNEARGGNNFSPSDEGCLISDLRPQENIQAVHRRNTVKELLMIKRQKWNSLQDDNNPEHKFKSARSEDFPFDTSPHVTPVNSNITSYFPPENVHVAPQQMQLPALQGPAAPTADNKMTLFHWQIQREARRVGELSPEMLNMQDADGDTCLHIAVAQGRRALAYVLAAKMADCGSLDVKEHNGQTALQIATATNQHLIVRDLLGLGAQVDTRDLWGRSPLHVCAEKGHFLSLQSIWMAVMERASPFDIEMFNYDGFTPLHAAVLSHNNVVKELASLENPCSYMVMEMVERRKTFVECVKTLLLMGASLGTKDLKSGRTCLHMASEGANVELLNIFLDQPSSLSFVNAKTFSGNTALHVVSSLQNQKSQVDAVKLLMRKGADPGNRNFENELPSQLVPEGPVGEKVRHILKGKYVHA